MATYYVDPAATGLNDGLTWADAFTDMQSAVAVATSSDVVYCRGTQVLSTAITLSCGGGTTSGMIEWIGCNASGVDDGTRFVLDGNSVAANCLNSDGGGYNRFKNFEITGATSHGVGDATADSSSCTFINCKFHLNGGMGFNAGSWGDVLFYKCAFNNNGSYGSQSNYAGTTKYIFCTFLDNASDGYYQYINTAYSSVLFGCIFAGNTYGLDLSYGGWVIINCVIDGNTSGGIYTDLSDCYRGVAFIGNRVTNNNGYGFNDVAVGNFIGVVSHNYFEGNTSGDFSTYITLEGLLEEGGVDTNQYTGIIGYADAANGDYNLTSDATMRRVPITLPE